MGPALSLCLGSGLSDIGPLCSRVSVRGRDQWQRP